MGYACGGRVLVRNNYRPEWVFRGRRQLPDGNRQVGRVIARQCRGRLDGQRETHRARRVRGSADRAKVTAAVALRPAVAVAVAGSDPVGLSSADLVFQEMTVPVRYLAVFQSDEASTVGTVTSTNPSDGQTLSVLHPLTGYDGGTSSFISVLDASKIIDDGYAGHASLYSAGSDGLTVSTAALVAAGPSDAPPPPLFAYRLPSQPLATVDESHPTSVKVEVTGQRPSSGTSTPGPTVGYRWRAARG